VCEGRVTEREYFSDLRHHERIALSLEFSTGGVPHTLVQKAVDAKRGQRQYDQIWVVFDIDEHPHVAEAKRQAMDNGIHTAVSNPCFELWPLFHFQDQTASITRHQVQSRCRKHMNGYEKRLNYLTLRPRLDDAIKRALHLRHLQSLRGEVGGNPSTDVDMIVKSLLDAKK
jgi:hypothetical protein